jgi:hypothetical protein
VEHCAVINTVDSYSPNQCASKALLQKLTNVMKAATNTFVGLGPKLMLGGRLRHVTPSNWSVANILL